MHVFTTIATISFLLQGIRSETLPPVVKIPSLGTIEGSHGRTINNQTIYSFEGVPYATPPVDSYRFSDPVPAKPWVGTWIANTIYKCLQYNHLTSPGEDFITGEEDCLYLNIYTPTLEKDANLNVIVYIHGGAFMFNCGGQQGPDIILDRNVVYVNLNYRLGPFGFLSTESDLVPGNNGIKDQILALEWIKSNIQNFGGNPNSITISGMSAGGASVHLHYLIPKSKNLFHRGISQSGTALNPWVLMENALEKTHKLAAIVGCSSENVEEIVDCLKRRPGRQIASAVKHFLFWLYNPFSPFGVVVDTWSSNPLLPAHPLHLLMTKQVADLPWIASFVNSEGLYPAAEFYDDQHLSEIDLRWNELMPFILDYNYTVDPMEKDKVSQQIRKFYLKNANLTKSTYMNLVKLIGDRLFFIDIEKATRLHASVTTSPVYIYHFTYRGANSKSEFLSRSSKNFGAAHGDDTSYVFRTKINTLSNENDALISKIMVDIFISFMKHGKPKTPVDWRPLSKQVADKFVYLKIESPQKMELEKKEEIGNRQFWDSLPLKDNHQLFEGIKDEL